MMTEVDPEPDQHRSVFFVGQDKAGHWLVQETSGQLEGRFISRAAAISFALAERHAFGDADVVISSRPLVPAISFDPVGPDEQSLARAA
jgi:hypothetical protein